MCADGSMIGVWGIVASLVVGGLLAVAVVCWLHERDIHFTRPILALLHRPIGEILVVSLLIIVTVHTGATKGTRNAPRRSPPREMQSELAATPESVGTVAGLFSSYTNAVTNVCATGILPLSNSVLLRAHWPIGIGMSVSGIEVYARHDLMTNNWSGIGTAPITALDNSAVIELPGTLLPDGWNSSMFFTLGFAIDTDGDGLSDAFETLVTRTDPLLVDSDGDGLADDWEYAMGLDPLSDEGNDGAAADADGDGFSNLEEYWYGTHPAIADTDGDGLDDRQEIGMVEELRGADFLWLDTTGHASTFGTSSTYDTVRTKIPLPFGVEVNGVCYTNAQIDLDGLVTLINPDRQSASIGSGYGCTGGVSNHLWSADHVTIAAYNTDVYARPRANDWGSAFTHGVATNNGVVYSVVEYRNVSHYNLGIGTSARMSFQVILPANETNVVYVSYLNVDDAISALDRSQDFGIQLPATNCVPGRGVYANVPWGKYDGCFAQPLTLKYTLGTGTNPNAADGDGDGLSDCEEVFAYHSDPYCVDTDGDGLNDGQEVAFGTAVNDSDTDGDGMDDGWEVQNGTDPLVDDASADPDWDGLANIWECYNGTDPHNEDTDGDMLADGVECGWYEDGLMSIPWFAIQPLHTYAVSNDVDNAMIGCAMPFANRLAGSRIDVALADVNGVVYFGRSDTTNGIRSSDSGLDLSEERNMPCAIIAAYWSDLKMYRAQGSSITFGTAMLDATNRFFVVQYLNVGTYSGGGNSISLQISIPENQPDLVYVRYGTVVDTRSNGYVSIGAQGAKVSGFASRPCFNYLYQSGPPTIDAGRTVAFHFGAGSDPCEADTDADGLDDRVEHIIGTDPRKTDTDGDGFDDAEEIEYGLSPVSAVGIDGVDGDFDGDGIANGQETKFGTVLNVADCDGDGLSDGTETGYIAVSNCLPWLAFDQFEDCTVDLVYATHHQYHVNRGLPCVVSVQDELVTNITFTSYGWMYLNRAGIDDRWRSDGVNEFKYVIDGDTLAIAAYGDGSMFVATNAAERSTVVRYGTATHDGVGYVVLEYDNLYRELSNYRTNSISFQIAMPTNRADHVYIQYRDVTGEYMNGRYCGIGMQTFDGRWMHSYCYCKTGKVYDGLGLLFSFGRNTAPLERDSDGDGLADGEEIELGTSPNHVDSDGDGLPDGWERDHELDPLSAGGDDGAWGDVDGDGLPNGKEYEYGTNPLLADTDYDGLADGQEVVDTFENPTIPWVTLFSPIDLTDAFSNEWECVNYTLPSPIQVQCETVTNITIDAHGVIYLNRAGYDNRCSASSGYSLDYVIDKNCAVIAPYWSRLGIGDVIEPSSIRIGTASVGTNDCIVIEYVNMYYQTYREDETNAVSFQVAIPLGRADRISVKYASLVGERMDGRSAEIGFQTFDFEDYSEYCDYDYHMISDGTGLVFLLGCGTDPKRSDTDRDGLTDGEEVNVLGSDPRAVDTDGDGIADGDEIEIGTSPINADSDGDGLHDGWERDNGLDPLSSAGDDGASGDPDNDGLTNIQEQAHDGDPNKPDTDGDGLSDSREVTLGTGVAVADTDGDGLSDGDEDTRGTNPRQMDSDGDGLSDGWEVENSFNPLSPGGATGEATADTDGDGLTNLQEMQHGTNPRLTDTDGDGIGDSAEVTLGTSPLRSDTDRDGLSDSQEQNLGLNPCQPDSDGDGMNDGWEYRYREYGFDPAVANANDPHLLMGSAGGTGGQQAPHTGPDDDLDGDGLTNAEECSFGTNPGVMDSDEDGVSDGDEVANSSDPADGDDNGEPNCRRRVRFYFGDDSGSHSEKYQLRIAPVSGPTDDATPSSFTWINENYGRGEWKTAMLKPGWKYRVQLQWIACKEPQKDGYYPNYDYTLKYETEDCVIIKEDPSSLFRVDYYGGEYYGDSSFPVLDCEAYLVAIDIEHDLLWETSNKANQIFNPTPKDDFTGEGEVERNGIYSYAAHRDYLYVVEDKVSHSYSVTEKIKPLDLPAKFVGMLMCAAFEEGRLVQDSSAYFSEDYEATMHIKVGGSDPDLYEIRVGFDQDNDGKLSCDESVPLEVYRHEGRAKYAIICGTTNRRFNNEDTAIRGYVTGSLEGFMLPVAQSFLSIFYNGNEAGIAGWLQTPTLSMISFDAFAHCMDFSEWLTHNSGANFTDDRHATIIEYGWGSASQMAQFMAQRTPLVPWRRHTANVSLASGMLTRPFYMLTPTGFALMEFFKNRVKPEAMNLLADAPDGATRTLTASVSNGKWTNEELEAFVFGERNPVVLTSTTQNFGVKGPYSGKLAVAAAIGMTALTGAPHLSDLDAFFSIGRGRLSNPVYTFTVRKTENGDNLSYDLVSIGFTGVIEDLYDFNFEDGALSQQAAILQIGYGSGQNDRQYGKIYRHRILLDTTYDNPFIR